MYRSRTVRFLPLILRVSRKSHRNLSSLAAHEIPVSPRPPTHLLDGFVCGRCKAVLIIPRDTLFYRAIRAVFTGAPKKSELSTEQLDERKYNEIADDTLDSLTAFFEDLNDNLQKDQDFDVTFSNGVLTVNISSSSTFVINKQTPNRQIWLSSPLSGPKRFDFANGSWTYLHDGTNLHELLSREITEILKQPVSFAECSYS